MERTNAKADQLTGNARYEGFIIDLVNELARLIGFNYTLFISDTYGTINEQGEWNGMIKDLLEEVMLEHKKPERRHSLSLLA